MSLLNLFPKIFYVGGCVRDALLGIQPKDIDYVVVGADHQWMVDNGFQHIHASSFPIYLKNGEEYALARREKKVAVGYHGFECQFDSSVTIEDDLLRRDLTINSLAVKIEDWDNFVTSRAAMANHQICEFQRFGTVIDPYGGINDLLNKTLCHTSEAFADDPIRVLRTARFASRYNFTVHPDTIKLMRKVVPELSTVPQERIWAEFQKGLMEKHPAKMFEVLFECGALYNDGPLTPYIGVNLKALNRVVDKHDICVRFTLISQNFKPVDYEECRIPTECAQVSKLFYHNVNSLTNYTLLSTINRLKTLERVNALNHQYHLVTQCLQTLECVGVPNYDDVVFNIMRDIQLCKIVNCAAIAATCSNGQEIKQKIFDARVKAMESI